jgi:hypothetical protein
MNANGSLSLGQRKLVQKEIAREFRAWRKKLRREPTEDERRQIIRIGFEIARRKNKRIPAANPWYAVTDMGRAASTWKSKREYAEADIEGMSVFEHPSPQEIKPGQLVRGPSGLPYYKKNPDIASALVAGAMGAVVNKVMSNPPLTAWQENGTKAGPYPFAQKEAQYAQYTIAQLLFAQRDAHKAAEAMRGTEAENWYRDDVSTISNEIRHRRELGGGGAPPGMKCHKCGGVAVFDRAEGFYCRPCFERMTQENPLTPLEARDLQLTAQVEHERAKALDRDGQIDEAEFHRGKASMAEQVSEEYAANPGHTTTKTCVVCGRPLPYSWPWLSWEGKDICSQDCFSRAQSPELYRTIRGGMCAKHGVETWERGFCPKCEMESNPPPLCPVCKRGHLIAKSATYECSSCAETFEVQSNPTGIAFSGTKYYRPARRVGNRIVRKRYRLTADMEPIARDHEAQYKTHPVRNNPAENPDIAGVIRDFLNGATSGGAGGRAYGHPNVYIEGDTIYSYGPHFPMARRIGTDELGRLSVLVTATKPPSVSTARQLNLLVRMAREMNAHLQVATLAATNPLLMTVMGANPGDPPEAYGRFSKPGPMPTDPSELLHTESYEEPGLREMSQLSRFRGIRHSAGFAPTRTQCYAGVMTPGEPPRITRLRQIAAGGIARCTACAPPTDEELEVGEWIRAGKKKHEDAPCAECINRTTFEGAPLDPLSASVIVQVYDALKPHQREKFAKLPLSMMDKMLATWASDRRTRAKIVGFVIRATGERFAETPPSPRFQTGVLKENPGNGRRRKVTMSLEKFAAMVKAKNDPQMWANFVEKVKGYQKWTHGSMPKKVTLETVDVPGVTGMWITYDMGREPEKLYVMPHGSKRKGAWRHPWEKMPHLKGDPGAGIMLTKTVKGNKITDFLHG